MIPLNSLKKNSKVPDKVELMRGYDSPGYNEKKKAEPVINHVIPSKQEEAARYKNISEDGEALGGLDSNVSPSAGESQAPPTYKETQEHDQKQTDASISGDGYMEPLSSQEVQDPMDSFPDGRSPAVSFSEPLLGINNTTPAYETPMNVDPSVPYSTPESHSSKPSESISNDSPKSSRKPLPSSKAPSRDEAIRSINNTNRPVLSRQQNTHGDSRHTKLPEIPVPIPPPSSTSNIKHQEAENDAVDVGYIDLTSC